jgi:hypothetical protein
MPAWRLARGVERERKAKEGGERRREEGRREEGRREERGE